MRVFNTPLESGIRSAALLLAAYPAGCDLQRLVQYDYLVVHSGDVAGGPPSIHPATPHRSSELMVRRKLVEEGLAFMATKRIVERTFGTTGIIFTAGEYALLFLETLATEYVAALRERAMWVTARFGLMADDELNAFMRRHWSQWGSEFVRHPIVDEGDE